jgi:hypothetical protein
MPDQALVEAIRKLLAASPFHGEGYRNVWARLRCTGICTSRRRVLRLMRAHDLLAPGRVGRPHDPKAHDGMIHTERVDAMWGTDLTSTPTGEGQASIFVKVDHASAEMPGHPRRPPGAPLRDDLGGRRWEPGARFEELEPLRQGVRAAFGAFGESIADGLQLRHDHGSQFVAGDDQRESRLPRHGKLAPFVREPEGNGCVERFIRTLKENLLWVRRFASIEELRLALHAFKETYNQTWIIERHGYQTSATRAASGCQMKPQRAVSQLLTATEPVAQSPAQVALTA